MPEDDGFALDVNDFKSEEDKSPEVETQDTTAEESSTPEKKETVEADQETEAEDTEASGDTEAEEESTDETEEKPKAKNSAENRKQQLNQEIRELVATRDKTRREVEQVTSQYYKPASTDQLVEQGMSESDAKFESLKQELAIRDYTAQVTEMTNAVNTESLQIFSDFPQFDPESSDYDKELAEETAKTYQEIAGIREDPNTGHIVDVKVLPYNFYKFVANTQKKSQTRGEVSARKNVEKQFATAENPVSTAKTHAPKKDSFEEGFDSIK